MRGVDRLAVVTVCTTAGGINGEQFISSMELFDMSQESDGQELGREWRVSSKVLAWQRYQHAVASVPRSKVRDGIGDITNREIFLILSIYFQIKSCVDDRNEI